MDSCKKTVRLIALRVKVLVHHTDTKWVTLETFFPAISWPSTEKQNQTQQKQTRTVIKYTIAQKSEKLK